MDQEYRKEEEMFRFLFVEGNAYSKQQLASLLGMKDHHFDKFYRNFKKEFEKQHPDYLIKTQRKKQVFHRFKYDAYQYDQNILISMYRKNKSQKSNEIYRLVQIIRTLADEPQSLSELVEFLEGDEEKKKSSYQRSIDYLLEIEAIQKQGNQYALDHSLLEQLSDHELMDLYTFVHYKANTHLLSVPGYLLLEFLEIYLKQKLPDKQLEFLWYRFIHFSRVLAEYKCYELMKAMEEKRMVSFRYYSKKQKQKANTKNEVENKPSLQKIIPLYLLFDHQYGRWYLIGKNPKYDISIYKLEGISEMEPYSSIEAELFEKERANARQRLKHSWLLSDEEEVEVVLRFYFDPSRTDSKMNFIEQRVRREMQWGIMEQDDKAHSFTYKIKVNGIKEIKPWILSFGSSVEVLEPQSLRQQIQEEWSELLKEYEEYV